jgi:ribosomal protein L44E
MTDKLTKEEIVKCLKLPCHHECPDDQDCWECRADAIFALIEGKKEVVCHHDWQRVETTYCNKCNRYTNTWVSANEAKEEVEWLRRKKVRRKARRSKPIGGSNLIVIPAAWVLSEKWELKTMLLWGWKRITEFLKEQGLTVSQRTTIYWAHQYHWPIRWINRSPVIEKKQFLKIIKSLPSERPSA